MTLRHVIGYNVKRTVVIGAVALWYQLVLAKFSKRTNIAKALFSLH